MGVSISIDTDGADFITLDEAKSHLVVDHSDDDVLIRSQISAARKYAEHYTSRFFTPTNITLSRNGFSDEMPLKHKPVAEILSIVYDDADATGNALASTFYDLDSYGNCVRRAYGQTWPSTRYHWNSVRIQYRVGVYSGSPEVVDVPEDVKAACLLVIGDLYENREAKQQVQLYSNKAAEMLLGKYRVWE